MVDYIQTLFSTAFEKAVCIEFKEEFNNGTGYFDKLTEYPVPAGEIRKTEDPYGRRILLLGTILGTVVIFDRYSGQKDKDKIVLVYNAPISTTLNLILGGTNLNADILSEVISHDGENKLNDTLYGIMHEMHVASVKMKKSA